jgi:hypoxanthine phosphoribosyltransferase
MTEPGDKGTVPDLVFAHPSEAEFARLLDFYKIEWQYEPRTFVLRRYPDGNIREAFTPDFYLPGQNVYIELTTLDRSLMTAKRRKMRRLRQLHPEVNIKLFDRENFEWLLLKYGLQARSDELVGKEALEPAGATE